MYEEIKWDSGGPEKGQGEFKVLRNSKGSKRFYLAYYARSNGIQKGLYRAFK